MCMNAKRALFAFKSRQSFFYWPYSEKKQNSFNLTVSTAAKRPSEQKKWVCWLGFQRRISEIFASSK